MPSISTTSRGSNPYGGKQRRRPLLGGGSGMGFRIGPMHIISVVMLFLFVAFTTNVWLVDNLHHQHVDEAAPVAKKEMMMKKKPRVAMEPPPEGERHLDTPDENNDPDEDQSKHVVGQNIQIEGNEDADPIGNGEGELFEGVVVEDVDLIENGGGEGENDADIAQFDENGEQIPRADMRNGDGPIEPDDPIESEVGNNDDYYSNHHIIFSTSCSVQQDWQSYLFFFQARRYKQPGTVTRIVSGCLANEEQQLQKLHDTYIKPMSPNFFLHFTPEYGKRGTPMWQTTKYWNKPNGVRHWLENKFGYKYDKSHTSEEDLVEIDGRTYKTGTYSHTEHDDDIVILVDPDMLLQRAFVNDYSGYPMDIWTSMFQGDDPNEMWHKVSQGHPIAQDYSFSTAWFEASSGNRTHVVGTDSNVHTLSNHEVQKYYPAGPPYVLTARDMFKVATHWSDILPRLFDVKAVFMSEMYAYCTAAAHLGLRHQLARGMMVSNVEMTHGEGWYSLDDVPPKVVCAPHETWPEASFKLMPHVLHFCQRYSIGDFFLSKYKTNHKFLSCESPLFQIPENDCAERYDYSHYGDGSVIKYEPNNEMDQLLRIRNAFMVSTLLQSMNEAAIFYKDHHCEGNKQTTYKTTWNFFEDEKAELEKKKNK